MPESVEARLAEIERRADKLERRHGQTVGYYEFFRHDVTWLVSRLREALQRIETLEAALRPWPCHTNAYRPECVQHAAAHHGAHEPKCAASVAALSPSGEKKEPPHA